MDFFEADFHLNPRPALRAVAQVHAQIQRALRNNNLNIGTRGGGGRGGGGGGGRFGAPNQFGNFAQGINRGIAPLGRITSNISEFNKSLDAANARVLAFGASTGVIFAVSKATKTLVSDFIEVEKKLASIQVILQATSSDFSAFSKELFKIASATGQSFDSAAEAAGEFSRQGLSLKQTLDATNAALTLTRLTGLDAAKSVEALTAVVNTFNKEGLTYTQVVDKLASVDAAFAVSSADLAEAIKRVGSSAVDAGVSLDELNAAVAAVKQVTGREGSVIGNSFKTIFARIQRSDVQSSLNSIGIATKEANGEFRNAIDVLRDLSLTLDNISDQESADIIEKVAGVRQINILRAMVTTLKGASLEASLFGKGLDASENSIDAAVLRNTELNQTTAALLNTTRNSITEFNSIAGKITFEPLIRQLASETTGLFSNLTALIGQEEGFETAGGDLAKGVLKGFANIISGPGFLVAIGIVGKTFAKLAKDFVGSVNTLFRDTTAQAQQLSVILNTISEERRAELGAATSLAERQRLINKLVAEELVLRRNNNALITQSAAALPTNLVRGLQGRRGFPGGFASGFIPALAKEQEQINAGVGGARRSAKPKIISANLGQGVKKIIVNSDEYVVDNFNGTGLSAVLTRDMANSLGGLSGINKFGDVRQFASGSTPPFQGTVGNAIIGLPTGNALRNASLDYLRILQDSAEKAAENARRQNLDDSRFITQSQAIREIILTRQKKIASLSTNYLLNGNFSAKLYGRGTTGLVSQEVGRRVENEREVVAEQARAQGVDAAVKRREKRARDQRAREILEERRSARSEKITQIAKDRFNNLSLRLDSKRGAFGNLADAFIPGRAESRISRVGVKTGASIQTPSLVQQSILDAKNRASNTRRNVAFGAGFGVPFVGGIVSQQLGGENTTEGRIANSVAQNAGVAGIAASLGTLGAVIGGTYAAFNILNTIIGETGEDIGALRSRLAQENEQRQKNLQEGQNFIAAQNELTSLIESGANEARILQSRRARDSAFFGISDQGTREEFANAKTDLERAQISRRDQDQIGISKAFGDFLVTAEEAFKPGLFKDKNFLKENRSDAVAQLTSQFKPREGANLQSILNNLSNIGGGTLADVNDETLKSLSLGEEAIAEFRKIASTFNREGQGEQFKSISDSITREVRSRLEDLIKLGGDDQPEQKRLQNLNAVLNNLKLVLSNRETKSSLNDIRVRGSEELVGLRVRNRLENLPDSERKIVGLSNLQKNESTFQAFKDIQKNDSTFKEELQKLATGIEDKDKQQEVLSLFDEDNPDLSKIREEIIKSSAEQEQVRYAINEADNRRAGENAKIATLLGVTVAKLEESVQNEVKQLAQLKIAAKVGQDFTPEQTGKDLEARAKATLLLTPESIKKTIQEATKTKAGISLSRSDQNSNLAAQARQFAAAAAASVEGFNKNLLPTDRLDASPEEKRRNLKARELAADNLAKGKITSALGAQASVVPDVVAELGKVIDTATKGRSPGFRENALGGKSNIQTLVNELNKSVISGDPIAFQKTAEAIDLELEKIGGKAPKGENRQDILTGVSNARSTLKTFLTDALGGGGATFKEEALRFAKDQVGLVDDKESFGENKLKKSAAAQQRAIVSKGKEFSGVDINSQLDLRDSKIRKAQDQLSKLKAEEKALNESRTNGLKIEEKKAKLSKIQELLGGIGLDSGLNDSRRGELATAFVEEGGSQGAANFGERAKRIAINASVGKSPEGAGFEQGNILFDSIKRLFEDGAQPDQIRSFLDTAREGFQPAQIEQVLNNLNSFKGNFPEIRSQSALSRENPIDTTEIDRKIQENKADQESLKRSIKNLPIPTASTIDFSDGAFASLDAQLTKTFDKIKPIPEASLVSLAKSSDLFSNSAKGLQESFASLDELNRGLKTLKDEPLKVTKEIQETIKIEIADPGNGLTEETKTELYAQMEAIVRRAIDKDRAADGKTPSKAPPLTANV